MELSYRTYEPVQVSKPSPKYAIRCKAEYGEWEVLGGYRDYDHAETAFDGLIDAPGMVGETIRLTTWKGGTTYLQAKCG